MNLLCRITTGLMFAPVVAAAGLPPAGGVSGSFTVNGEPVALRHAYVFRQNKGFYDPADPTWTVLLTAEPVAPRDVDDRFIDPSLRLGLTLTAEFGDGPSLRVLSHDLLVGSFSLSGGQSPELDLELQGPEIFAGRIRLAEPQTFFDHEYHYDLSFHALPVDPKAAIGDALPKGGGEPGAACLAWTRAVHARDIEVLKAMVTPDMAATLDEPEAAYELGRLASTMPTDVRIVEGSSDGSTAILRAEGRMDGKAVKGEVTLDNHDGHWMPTAFSIE